MSNENIAIITFIEGWEQDGVGPDGLPLFREAIKIRKSVPPLTQVEYVATPEDFEEFPGPYALFRKQQGARRPDVKGYPLALWPVVSPADLQTLAARDIVTVEQLAQLANKRGDNTIPAPVVELAKRARKLVELQGSIGKFEAMITELTGERDQLAAELKEANATIAAQNVMLNRLKVA